MCVCAREKERETSRHGGPRHSREDLAACDKVDEAAEVMHKHRPVHRPSVLLDLFVAVGVDQGLGGVQHLRNLCTRTHHQKESE